MRLVVLCSLLVACGFEATTGGPTALPDATGQDTTSLDATVGADAAVGVDATQLTPQTFIEQAIREECKHAFACRSQYPSGAASFASDWGTDVDDCVRIDSDYRARDKIAAAVAGGTITFDPAQALTCLASFGVSPGCSTLFSDNYRWADSCYAALLGHIADGGTCITDWECAIASVCRSARCVRY